MRRETCNPLRSRLRQRGRQGVARQGLGRTRHRGDGGGADPPNGTTVLDARVRVAVRRSSCWTTPGRTQSRCGWRTRTSSMLQLTPYLAITSAEKRSAARRGCSRCSSCSYASRCRPRTSPTPRCSASIDDKQPTLLIDEVDAIFGKKSRSARSCAGSSTPATGAGRRPTAWAARTTRRCRRSRSTARRRSPGSATACPDTIADRAIPIRLKRRTRDERVERFRLRDVEPEGHDLRDRLADWLEPQRDYLAESGPICRTSSTTEHRTSGNRCSRSPTWRRRLAGARTHGSDRALERRGARGRLRHRAVDPRHQRASSSANDDEPLKTSDLLDGLYGIEEIAVGRLVRQAAIGTRALEAPQGVSDQDDVGLRGRARPSAGTRSSSSRTPSRN